MFPTLFFLGIIFPPVGCFFSTPGFYFAFLNSFLSKVFFANLVIIPKKNSPHSFFHLGEAFPICGENSNPPLNSSPFNPPLWCKGGRSWRVCVLVGAVLKCGILGQRSLLLGGHFSGVNWPPGQFYKKKTQRGCWAGFFFSQGKKNPGQFGKKGLKFLISWIFGDYGFTCFPGLQPGFSFRLGKGGTSITLKKKANFLFFLGPYFFFPNPGGAPRGS